MASKQLNARILLRRDTEANWVIKGIREGFVPMDGEMIIYQPDESHPFARYKIGDGVHMISDLPFPATAVENVGGLEEILGAKSNVGHTHEVVNGHTVEEDVPAGAVFTDTVYDDTEVRELIGEVRELAESKMDTPAGGSTGQILQYSAPGEGVWATPGWTHAAGQVITLLSGAWSGLAQQVDVSGVTANNFIIVQPADNASKKQWTNYGVFCSSQSAGKLTFVTEAVPDTDLNVNVLILTNG